MNSQYSIIPLGGVREIGSNMALFKSENEIIMVDCGILFPHDEVFDLKYLIPDVSAIDKDKFKNLIITHGHEDHIGAIFHIAQMFPEITIWSPQFASFLIRKKLESLSNKPKINIYQEDSLLEFDDFLVNPVRVNHSIPDTFGLVITRRGSGIKSLYISDFKVDEHLSYEEVFNFSKINKCLENATGVLGLLDSTNILNTSKTPSEVDLRLPLENIFQNQKGRLIFTFFASNLWRMKTIVELAIKYQRKIFLAGRSWYNYLEAFKMHPDYSSDLDNLRSVEDYDNEEDAVILATGCQGDFFSALKKIVDKDYKHIKITKDDLVIFSSKIIPGNEKKVHKMINKIYEQKGTVLTAYDDDIHASGHPGQKDLRVLYTKIKFDFIVPIHGDSYFLYKHQEFIKNNFPNINCEIALNYDEIVIGEKSLKIIKGEPLEPIIIHGNLIPIDRKYISQRRKMASLGLVSIAVAQKKPTSFKIETLGIPLSDDLKGKMESMLENYIRSDLKNVALGNEEEIRVFVRKNFNQFLGYKPVTLVHII